MSHHRRKRPRYQQTNRSKTCNHCYPGVVGEGLTQTKPNIVRGLLAQRQDLHDFHLSDDLMERAARKVLDDIFGVPKNVTETA